MKGSYNPVTQAGSGEIGRVDYQESRKNTAVTGGTIIVILLVLAGIAYFFFKQAQEQMNATAESVKQSFINIVPKIPSISDTSYFAQNIGKTVAADGSTYMGVPAEKGTEIRAVLDYFANKNMPFDDPLHNVGDTGSLANLNFAVRLTDKLNTNQTFSQDELYWAKTFEPVLYNMIVRSMENVPTNAAYDNGGIKETYRTAVQ